MRAEGGKLIRRVDQIIPLSADRVGEHLTGVGPLFDKEEEIPFVPSLIVLHAGPHRSRAPQLLCSVARSLARRYMCGSRLSLGKTLNI